MVPCALSGFQYPDLCVLTPLLEEKKKKIGIFIQQSAKRYRLRLQEPGSADPPEAEAARPRMGWLRFSLSLSISLAFL